MPSPVKREKKYSYLVDEIIAANPENGKYSAYARELIAKYNISGTPKQLAIFIRDTLNNAGKSLILGDQSETQTQDYEGGGSEDKSLKSYCELHNIDFESVRSAKFINHQGQGAWNIVIDREEVFDLTKFTEDIREVITETVTPYEPKKKKSNGQALMIYLADEHIGSEVKDSVYHNQYNEEIFHKRLMTAIDLINEKSSMFGRFESIYFLILGDSPDHFNGHTTRGGHYLPNNMSNNEITRAFIKSHKQLIDTAHDLDKANNYHFYGMANSNHGGDFEYAMMVGLQEYLNVKYPKMVTHVEEKFVSHFAFGDHTIIYTHGKDKIDRKSGMPKHLDPKTENWIKDYISYHKLEGYITFVKGDLHVDCEDMCNRFRYRNTTSLFGASRWIHTNFGWSRAGISYDIIPKNSHDIMKGCYYFDC